MRFDKDVKNTQADTNRSSSLSLGQNGIINGFMKVFLYERIQNLERMYTYSKVNMVGILTAKSSIYHLALCALTSEYVVPMLTKCLCWPMPHSE